MTEPILRVRGLKKSFTPPGETPGWMYLAGYSLPLVALTLLGALFGGIGALVFSNAGLIVLGAGIGFNVGFAGGLILGGELTEVIFDAKVTSGRLSVLNGVDLDVAEGETLAIVGPSGAGKSTLLHLMGALEPPSDGSIIFRGRDVTTLGRAGLNEYRNKRVGFVFQFYYLFPELTALDNVLVPAMIENSALAWNAGARARYTARARELLREVGLADREKHKPTQLSGGEQQRVAIARALLLDPELLLCDEPTGNLDRATGEEVLELLWRFKKQGKHTYVIVTHDMRLAARADRTVEMEDGRVKSFPTNGEPAVAEKAAPAGKPAAPAATAPALATPPAAAAPALATPPAGPDPVDPALLDTDSRPSDTPPGGTSEGTRTSG